jgi:uncharacterized protein (DUF2147 family)
MIALVLIALTPAHAEENGVLGRWMDPTGSIIEINRCAASVCARLVALGKQAPSRVDANNPDRALRARLLCGLQIGSNFHLIDPNHADGGQLYDPKTGKTYSGSMISEGDSLKLRGYVGIKLFGRTETWTRVRAGAMQSGSQYNCS